MRQYQARLAMERLAEMKSSDGLRIIDTHIHPGDVLGVIHNAARLVRSHTHYRHDAHHPKKMIIDWLYGHRLERTFANGLIKLFPGLFVRTVRESFLNYNEKSMLAMMDAAMLDQVVLLPIEPWLPTKLVGEKYGNNNRLVILGSLDLKTIRMDDIDSTINRLIEQYGITGLKMHPNLQNFLPQPGDNPRPLADKLDLTYSTAAQKGLYLLFHGGYSSFPNKTHPAFGRYGRSICNGLLKNFIKPNGDSELLGHYDTPMIIAHLGNLGVSKPDFSLLTELCRRYEKLYFDTALMSADFIAEALSHIPPGKIVYGSDGLYANPVCSITTLYHAACQKASGVNQIELLRGLLAGNYESMLAMCR